MATTRRPQINHKTCDHAATPKARKACRKAAAAEELAAQNKVNDMIQEALWSPEANLFRSAASGLSHGLDHLADGTAVPACSRKVTKGTTEYHEKFSAAHATCNRCNGVSAENAGRAR